MRAYAERVVSPLVACAQCSDDGLEHVTDIRCGGRIAEDGGLQLSIREPGPHRQSEDIDHFLRVRTDEVRTENALGPFFNEHLEAGTVLGDPSRRIPGRGLLVPNPEAEVLIVRLALEEPDARDRRDGESNAGHAGIV